MKVTVRHIGARSILMALVVFFVVIGIAAYIGNSIYTAEKLILQQQGELNAKKAVKEYNSILLTRVNIITLVGCAVDNMIASGADSKMIEQYITEQTNYIIATLDPSTTGVYGWVNGEYIDGAGWVPDEDYVATERPWYTQTLESGQKITFVEPYLDLQTNTIMMTVAELMTDGKSVIAMDVSLNPLQQIVEMVSSATEGSQALVFDVRGTVVAHSDVDQLSANYLENEDSRYSAIARRILKDGQMQFDIKTADGNYSVYADELLGDWYSVSMINSDIWYRPLNRILIVFSAVLLFVVAMLVFVFLRLYEKNQTLQNLLRRIEQEEKRGKELKILSETDRMTGLYDHVSGKRKVDELLAFKLGGMFLELDIDNFKNINDTYGHQTGDLVIIATADVLRSTFRSNDVTMRLGGDEFGAFAVGITDENSAEAIIDRLFARLENLSIPELQGEKFYVSIGAVIFPGNNTVSFDSLYAAADSAMYASKKVSGNSYAFSSYKKISQS